MDRKDLTVVHEMKSRFEGNEHALYLLDIIESFIDHHEEEFRDLKESMEEYLIPCN